MTILWWQFALLFIPLALNFWAIWHIWAHEFSDQRQKMIWFVCAVFFPLFGAVAYLFFGRKHAGHRISINAERNLP